MLMLIDVLKFINDYKTAKIFLTAKSYRGHEYSCAIGLHNSLVALYANSCSNCQALWTTSEGFGVMAWLNWDVRLC